MTFKRGEIVGIPFPYSDLTTRKRRPVLILTPEDARGDFIALAITSVRTAERAVRIEQANLSSGQLPKISWVRCDKIFTLSVSSIIKRYGTLKEEVLSSVLTCVCTHLGCSV